MNHAVWNVDDISHQDQDKVFENILAGDSIRTPDGRDLLFVLYQLGDVFVEQRKRWIGHHDVRPIQELDALRIAEFAVLFKLTDANIADFGHPAAVRGPLVFEPYRPLRVLAAEQVAVLVLFVRGDELLQASALRVNYQDLKVRIDIEPEIGLADSSDLDTDLTDLLTTLGHAAHERGTAFVLFVDELQYVPEDQLASLITALHSTSQEQLPITMVAAGQPQLVGRTGDAKTYAERLFEFAPVDRLNDSDARDALIVPASKEGVDFHPDAVAEVVRETNGYPYFLQEWGKHIWNVANDSPIMPSDAQRATNETLAELDASFFRVRFDRLTPSQTRYLRAMAELGPGPHRSGDIAQTLDLKVTTVAPVRNSLITKGMIYSPAHGDTAFTVPLFDEFMKRIMPGRP